MIHKEAFSIHEVIGNGPYTGGTLELKDKMPFLVKPYVINEERNLLFKKMWLDYRGLES